MNTCPASNNTEIFEEYLLDRLAEDQRAAFTRHLQTCQVCRGRLEQEKKFLLVLRAAGRAELKRDLQEQLKELPARSSSVDRTVWYKIAAVLFFLSLTPALVYYYFNIYYPARIDVVEWEQARGVPSPPAEGQVTEEKEIPATAVGKTDNINKEASKHLEKLNNRIKKGAAVSAAKRQTADRLVKSRGHSGRKAPVIAKKSPVSESMSRREADEDELATEAPIVATVGMDAAMGAVSATKAMQPGLVYRFEPAPENVPGLKSIALSESTGAAAVYRYKAGQNYIYLTIQTGRKSARGTGRLQPPPELPVKVEIENKNVWHFSLQTDQPWDWFNPGEAFIELLADSIVRLHTDSLSFYEFQLAGGTTRGILKTPNRKARDKRP